MHRFIISLILLLVMAVASYGQTDFLPMGGSSTAAHDISVECSVGQVFCDYAASDGIVIGEGVQQPYDTVVFVKIDQQAALQPVSFIVYPNPSSQGVPLNVEVSGITADSRLQIYDILGRRMIDMPISDGTYRLPILLTAGSYTAVLRQNVNNSSIQKIIVR